MLEKAFRTFCFNNPIEEFGPVRERCLPLEWAHLRRGLSGPKSRVGLILRRGVEQFGSSLGS